MCVERLSGALQVPACIASMTPRPGGFAGLFIRQDACAQGEQKLESSAPADPAFKK